MAPPPAVQTQHDDDGPNDATSSPSPTATTTRLDLRIHSPETPTKELACIAKALSIVNANNTSTDEADDDDSGSPPSRLAMLKKQMERTRRYVKEIKTLDALSEHISPELHLGLLQYRYRKKTRAAHDRA